MVSVVIVFELYFPCNVIMIHLCQPCSHVSPLSLIGSCVQPIRSSCVFLCSLLRRLCYHPHVFIAIVVSVIVTVVYIVYIVIVESQYLVSQFSSSFVSTVLIALTRCHQP